MQIDMTVYHEEDEEEEEAEGDVVEDKVKFNVFLNTQRDILEDLDDCGYRKKNGSFDEVRQFLKQYPRCLHALDFQFIVPPKDSEDKHYVPATRTNDSSGNKLTKWIQTTIVATGKDIGDGINAPTNVDTKTTILRMGGVLDADVSIRKCPQLLLNKYIRDDVIRKNYIFVILSTGETVFMRTESDNTESINTRGTRYRCDNNLRVPTGVLESGKRYTRNNLGIVIHFTFCKKENRKWLGRMELDHMNRDRGDNRKVNLRLVWPAENILNRG